MIFNAKTSYKKEQLTIPGDCITTEEQLERRSFPVCCKANQTINCLCPGCARIKQGLWQPEEDILFVRVFLFLFVCNLSVHDT